MNTNANQSNEYDVLPIGIVFNPYFKAFNKCLMEFMCDYEYNRRWGNDRYHQIVLLELKDYIRTRFASATTGIVEIKYTGRCFTYRFIKKTHHTIQIKLGKNIYKHPKYELFRIDKELQIHYQLYKIMIERDNEFIEKTNIRIIEGNKTLPLKHNLVKLKEPLPAVPSQEEYKKIVGTYEYDKHLSAFLNKQAMKRSGSNLYKKRYVEKNMNYEVNPYSGRSVWNLKRWNAQGKTTNAGLSRIHLWTSAAPIEGEKPTEHYCMSGWDKESLEHFCKENGWKSKTQLASKLKYSDWAMWAYKVCDPLPSPYVYNWDLI
jgi:hypothetical protein